MYGRRGRHQHHPREVELSPPLQATSACSETHRGARGDEAVEIVAAARGPGISAARPRGTAGHVLVKYHLRRVTSAE